MNTYGKRALAAAVASLGAAALAPTASADTTLVLFEHDTVQHQVDLGGPGPGPGDQFIFAGDVFDRPGGVFLGTVGGSCTTLTGNDKAGQMACNGTFNLAGGQIVLQAVARHRSALRPRRYGSALDSRWHRDIPERPRQRHRPGTPGRAEPDRR